MNDFWKNQLFFKDSKPIFLVSIVAQHRVMEKEYEFTQTFEQKRCKRVVKLQSRKPSKIEKGTEILPILLKNQLI